ncbi:RNA methyltransferase [uncultured Roseobacter sp.]|uniref:RNA methyltransferase n=1 Tax=uncultured Roseobacter sp. TaxID=114847 RepID=UPI00261BEEFB|nr:RNA methyltransferase [uncultured Roseobacter sp.]
MSDPVEIPRAPAFVLVRPQMGENIGAAARAMLNFGLDHMRIVAPRDGWPNPAAVAMASGAGRVLDTARLSDDLAAGIGDCAFVFATTARSRDLTKPVYSPEAAMKLAAEKTAQGQRVAVLFGPERAGLENDDIAKANAIISVPVNPEFPSLNLAQCVLLTGYEWMRAHGDVTHAVTEMAGTDWAEGIEIEHLAQHYEDRLSDAGFFFPQHKAQSMRTNLRNMWSRMPLTRADVQMLHGMLRQIIRGRDRDNQ